jgi:hypothetical protein
MRKKISEAELNAIAKLLDDHPCLEKIVIGWFRLMLWVRGYNTVKRR